MPYFSAFLMTVPKNSTSGNDEEHSPMLLKCPEWKAVRRFEITDGDPQPWTHLALHYLSDADAALSSAERDAARATDWRKKLAAEPWFQGSSYLYEAFGDRFLSEDKS